jgi:hypothetical protein
MNPREQSDIAMKKTLPAACLPLISRFPGRAVLLLAAMGLAACSPTRVLTDAVRPPMDWREIESTGGIRFGQAYRDSNGIMWLPVSMDLSSTGRKCLRVTLDQSDRLNNENNVYNLDLQVFAGNTGAVADGSCQEVAIDPLTLRPVITNYNQVTFRLWYRNNVLYREQIGEFRL